MSYPIKSTQGFILLPVVLALVLLAAIALIMNREGAGQASRGDAVFQAEQARYLAEAGLKQQSWRVQKVNCSGYTDLAATPLGSNSYSAIVSASSGSPITVTAIGTTASGASRTLSRSVNAYDTAAQNLVLQPDAASGADGWIDDKKRTWSYGVDTKLWVVENASGQPLLRFDLSSLPEHARVVSARLELFTTSLGVAADVFIHRITRSWVEGSCWGGCTTGATWNKYDGVNDWITAGGDFDATPSARSAVSAINTWYTWDITDLVADWVSGDQLNYGMLLKGGGASANLSFASSDNSTAANRPKLTLDYVCECGKSCSPPTGPIAHWLLDETSGTAAADAVGGHTGTLNGGTWTTGKLGGGLFLNGTNQFVSVANAADLSPASFTLAAWIKPATLTGYRMVLNKGTSGTNRQYWLGTVSDEISFGWYNGARREFNTTAANLQPSTWYHIAASYDAGSRQVKVYLNGTLLLTQTATILPLTNAEGITLGRSPSGEYWQGVLDDVWVQLGALSAAEIAALAGTPPPGTPVTVTLSATADSYVDENATNSNYGSLNYLIAGGDTSKSKEAIGLLNFAGISAIPAGATIQSASLRLYESTVAGDSHALGAHLVESSWTQTGVTWNNKPGIDTTVIASTTVNDIVDWKTWNVTPLVQQWVDAISPNYGIALRRPTGSSNPRPRFNTRENGSLRPELVVTYQ